MDAPSLPVSKTQELGHRVAESHAGRDTQRRLELAGKAWHPGATEQPGSRIPGSPTPVHARGGEPGTHALPLTTTPGQTPSRASPAFTQLFPRPGSQLAMEFCCCRGVFPRAGTPGSTGFIPRDTRARRHLLASATTSPALSAPEETLGAAFAFPQWFFQQVLNRPKRRAPGSAPRADVQAPFGRVLRGKIPPRAAGQGDSAGWQSQAPASPGFSATPSRHRLVRPSGTRVPSPRCHRTPRPGETCRSSRGCERARAPAGPSSTGTCIAIFRHVHPPLRGHAAPLCLRIATRSVKPPPCLFAAPSFAEGSLPWVPPRPGSPILG